MRLILLVRHRCCCFIGDMTVTHEISERNDLGRALPAALRLRKNEGTVVQPQRGSAWPLRAATAEARSPLRIWLIDDDDELRCLLSALLGQQDGIECSRHFSSAQAALDALAQAAAPDVILLDIQMGEQCGIDAIPLIKALAPGVQVLMLTTFYDSQLKAAALRAGASGFMLKSYTVEQMIELICRAQAESACSKASKPAALAPFPEAHRASSSWGRGIGLLRALRALGGRWGSAFRPQGGSDAARSRHYIVT